MRRSLALLCLAGLALALLVGGCGGDDDEGDAGNVPAPRERPPIFGPERPAGDGASPAALGIPLLATKNTTRVNGSDPAADAAGTALAVFPGVSPGSRPPAVALADGGDWRVATAAAALMAPPVRAPLLLSDGTELSEVTRDALDDLGPTGSRFARGAQVVSVGIRPDDAGGRRVALLDGDGPFERAAAVDRFLTSARGAPSNSVVVVGADEPAYGIPAAAWAAKSGESVLFVERDAVPAATRTALIAHGRPRIYVLGPPEAVSRRTVRRLERLGTVVRIAAPDPVRNAIAFARFRDRDFGWGITDPGHGFVLVNPSRPLDGPAGAALGSAGQFGPLLLVDEGERLPSALESYLLDVKPGYRRDPVRGVYNRAWIIGDEDAIPLAAQARVDELLEIAPVAPPPRP